MSRQEEPSIVAHSRRHFLDCGILWDGYQFPTRSPHSNSSIDLANYEGHLVTFPFPGYNGYHPLEAESTGRNDSFLWCGVLFEAAQWSGPQYGATIVVRKTPLEEIFDLFSLILEPDFMAFFMPVAQQMINNAGKGTFSGQIFTHQVTEMRIICTRRFIRQEFAFLNSFTGESWLAILASLLSVSLCLSIVRVFMKMTKKTSKKRAMTSTPFVGTFITVTFRLIGLLLSENDTNKGLVSKLKQSRYRILLGFWLLATVVLVGCMSGSMRDLMSFARKLQVPDTVQDLLYEPFKDYSYLEITAEFDHHGLGKHLKILNNEGRLIPINGIECYNEGWSCLARMLIELTSVTAGVAFKLTARLVLMSSWVLDLYEKQVVEAIEGFGKSGSEVMDRLDVLTKNLHVPQEESSWKIERVYIPVGINVPAQVTSVVTDTLERFRGMGMLDYAFVVGDERLAGRYLTRDKTGPDYEQLLQRDLTGPLVLWGAVSLGCSCTALIAEWFARWWASKT